MQWRMPVPVATECSLFEQRHRHSDDYATWLVKTKAAYLARRLGLSTDDREDIEQELFLDLIKRWERYDPSQSQPTTFIALVVRNRLCDLVKQHCTAKGIKTVPLPADDDDSDELEEDESIARRDTRQDSQSPLELPDPRDHYALVMDVEEALSRLSPELRELAECLKHYNISQAARQLGITRSMARRRLDQLRAALADSGLDEY